MIVLAAKCQGRPECTAEMERLADNVTGPSRAEEGCISYNVYQQTSNNEFIFFEEWNDRAALDAHFQTSHFQEFFRDFPSLLAHPPLVRVYEVSGSEDLQM